MSLTSLIVVAAVAAVFTTGIVAAILYQTLGLARDRYEISSGLALLAQISWHELQVLIGLGLRSRGLSAITSGDHEDTKTGAADLLLTDGTSLTVLRVKHGVGVQVDDHTIFDLGTRRDARKASAAMLATTGNISRAGELAAKDASITLLAGRDLWLLVNEHLPPRLRERIANGRRATLRKRIGTLIGSSVLAGAAALAIVYHVARSDLFHTPDQNETGSQALAEQASPSSADSTLPTDETTAAAPNPDSKLPAVAPISEAQAPASPKQKREPLSDAELMVKRRDTAATVRMLPPVFTASWSTASTLEVELRPNANLQDDSLFDEVCGILADTEDLRLTRVQLQLKDADPTTSLAARWRQCQ